MDGEERGRHVPYVLQRLAASGDEESGMIAGLDVMRVVYEPNATEIAAALTRDHSARTVPIFDLGGGDFDSKMVTCYINELVHKSKRTSTGNADCPSPSQCVQAYDVEPVVRLEHVDCS